MTDIIGTALVCMILFLGMKFTSFLRNKPSPMEVRESELLITKSKIVIEVPKDTPAVLAKYYDENGKNTLMVWLHPNDRGRK